jgi:hypothetical protein
MGNYGQISLDKYGSDCVHFQSKHKALFNIIKSIYTLQKVLNN